MSTADRRGFLRLSVAMAATTVLGSACGTKGSGTSSADPLRLGVILPNGGNYKLLGSDQWKGYQLALKLHGNRIGGRPVQVFKVDEGATPDDAAKAAKHLINNNQVHVITGCVSSLAIQGAGDVARNAKIPLLGANGNSSKTVGTPFIHSTSFINQDASVALAPYVAAHKPDAKFYLCAAGYQAGHDYVDSFQQALVSAGVKVSGVEYTPFPGTTDFSSAFDKIKASDATAVYAFYAGKDAINFVQQYKSYGMYGKYQLWAPGFLTEGTGLLAAEGDGATGMINSMHYSPDLDNPANRTFVAEYQKANDDQPNCYTVAAYDAITVLDHAVQAAGSDLSGQRLFERIDGVGQVDSPRGPWVFSKRGVPIQKWYLRNVQRDGGVLSNVVVEELGTFGA